MHSQKRILLVSFITALLAVVLWHVTFQLLGLPEPMSHGLKTGSLIVFAGCFALCRGAVQLVFMLFFPAPKTR